MLLPTSLGHSIKKGHQSDPVTWFLWEATFNALFNVAMTFLIHCEYQINPALGLLILPNIFTLLSPSPLFLDQLTLIYSVNIYWAKVNSRSQVRPAAQESEPSFQ